MTERASSNLRLIDKSILEGLLAIRHPAVHGSRAGEGFVRVCC